MRLFVPTASALILAFGFGGAALKADVPGTQLSSAPFDFGASVWNLGFEFQANSNVTVTGLGNMDFGSLSNLAQPQHVGLWSSSGNLLASAYVTSSSTQINYFAFTPITPVALSAGSFYIVGAQGGADYAGIDPASVAPQIAYITDLYTYLGTANSPLAEPLSTENYTSASQAGWFGGNVLLSATPEPSYPLVLGIGMAALCIIRRARASRTTAA